jgi:hypothetical protein
VHTTSGLMCPRTFFLERGVFWMMCPLNYDLSLTGCRALRQGKHCPRDASSKEKRSGTPRSETHRQCNFQSIKYRNEATAPACGATPSFSATEKQPARHQTGSAINTETGSQVPGLRELNKTRSRIHERTISLRFLGI